jgi:hypothetical protein
MFNACRVYHALNALKFGGCRFNSLNIVHHWLHVQLMCKKIEGSVGLVYMKKTNSVVSMVKGWGFEKKIKLHFVVTFCISWKRCRIKCMFLIIMRSSSENLNLSDMM